MAGYNIIIREVSMKVSYLKDDEDKTMSEDENTKDSPRRIMVGGNNRTKLNDQAFEGDILIVASKLKKYVKEKHGLNTSSNVMEALSSIVRIATDRAIDNAKREGRKTLMDRDF